MIYLIRDFIWKLQRKEKDVIVWFVINSSQKDAIIAHNVKDVF